MKKNNAKYIIAALLLIGLFVLSGCTKTATTIVYEPIYGFKFPSWDFIVWPMTALMWAFGKSIAFGNYGLAIVFSTIVVRTAAWPIYAKSNDMSLKMQLIGPEQAKIEARYAERTDQESQQKKQMEMMQLYKKYGIGFSGCLMPLLQLPIFISFFNTLRRIPSTTSSYLAANPEVATNLGITKLVFDFDFMNTTFFGINLFQDKSAGGWQETGIYILAILVGLTQLGSQILITKRQNKQKAKMQSDLPAYRRPERTEQQKQTDMMMKIMMYGMPVMMVVFIITSPAALGLYWFVGNIYSTLQSYLGFKSSEKRLEKLRTKMKK
ncbi:MAG: YidC/Oxa1 family membrane protein insertase [Bacilli bacterium]|nr:YidC/Oxa1 family membrane protein insertase [Bacilli bacterium]